jgi:hypothetical protein
MPRAKDRNRAAQVWRLRMEARRARHFARQVAGTDDHDFYLRLADECDQQADTLEQGGSLKEASPPASRSRSRP